MSDDQAILQFRNLPSGDAVREVAEALLGVEGVEDVEMDEEGGRTIVKLVSGVRVSREDLVKAVADAGHSVDQISMPAGR